MTTPRVSILIPNYNNGRASSVSGERDFIGELFQSLLDTLEDDPTPIEILVHDDGSSDDSLETCRAWAKRTWRGGVPFCTLTEGDHCGVLSVVANDLTRRARGEFCVRLDGDIVCLTPNWAEKLCRVFDEGPPSLGVVGPKQLTHEGHVHAAGDWILHPRGCHHVAQTAPRDAVTETLEVDHVMGCFYCHRRAVWEEIGGYDESILRGQTIDFGLSARLKGWRAWCIPTIEFTHNHGLRRRRNTRADTDEGIDETLRIFERKWGFNRLAPDLEAVAKRYAGTPLLWNASVFGPRAPWPKPAPGPLSIQSTEWGRFAGDANYREAIQNRLRIVQNVRRQVGPRRRVLHVHSRAGLLCHGLGQAGVSCVGVDPDPAFVEIARSIVAGETYQVERPQFHVQPDHTAIPLPDASVDTVLLFDLIERHPNPVGLFREARRVLEPAGLLAIVTPERRAIFDAVGGARHEYRAHELRMQLKAHGWFKQIGNAEADGGLIVALAVRCDERPGPRSAGAAPALAGAR